MSYIDTTSYHQVYGAPDLHEVADWTFVKINEVGNPIGVPLVLPGTFEEALAVVLKERHQDWRLIPPFTA